MRFYDPIYGAISVREPFCTVVESGFFRRLQYLRQMGLCFLAFPGGNHTRFEHSLGAFYLAKKLGGEIATDGAISKYDLERFRVLVAISALCHDLGHGPFSHMMENVLTEMGASLSHEEFGAAIIRNLMVDELSPFTQFGVSTDDICNTITKSSTQDPIVRCAQVVVSSILDVDRLDYLRRDAHYTGADFPKETLLRTIGHAWRLNYDDGRPSIDLTFNGCQLAEDILYTRRNHYSRVVFSERHMAATAMFNKALSMAAKSSSILGNAIQDLVGLRLDWRECKKADKNFLTAQLVYQMTDFEALRALDDCGESVSYLCNRLRLGKLHEAFVGLRWPDIHHRFRKAILDIDRGIGLFAMCRNIEQCMANHISASPDHIAVHIPSPPRPAKLDISVEGGHLLEDITSISHFIERDYYNQYRITVFADPSLSGFQREAAANFTKQLMLEGCLSKIGTY